MANARAIVKRRKAVRSIHKITRTMQLIATARFQMAYNRVTTTRPYTERIARLVEHVSRGRDIDHPLLRVNMESKHSVLIVLTSNRGLCGGYNAAVLREALRHIEARERASETVHIHAVGKKGIAYLRFLRRELASAVTELEDGPQFAEVEPISTAMINAYERKEIDSVHVAYTRFESTSRQQAETITLLPVGRLATYDQTGGKPAPPAEYEFSPPAEELLADLLPQMVKVHLFQCFLDAALSEHVARMVAMKAATDAAGDMIKTLTQQYNRARQAQITLELLDIVGGVEALR